MIAQVAYYKSKKFLQHLHGIIPNMFDFWADPVIHLLLFKSSMPNHLAKPEPPSPVQDAMVPKYMRGQLFLTWHNQEKHSSKLKIHKEHLEPTLCLWNKSVWLLFCMSWNQCQHFSGLVYLSLTFGHEIGFFIGS